jgi:MbtH protein
VFDDEARQYEVVRNHEDQYSIWPQELAVPDGWSTVGFAGDKRSCLARIDEVWTDLRPSRAPRTPEGRPA